MTKKELAKKLKDKGYDGGFLLGQLIEACGDGFNYLVKGKSFKFSDGHRDTTWSCNGSIAGWDTPEEAVAHLWLNLNEKK